MNMEKDINLLHCDSKEFIKTIPDKSIDFVLTDPPYDYFITGGVTSELAKRKNKVTNELKDVKISNSYDIEFYGEQFLRILKKVNICVFCNKWQILPYLKFYVEKHKCTFDILMYHKTNIAPTFNNHYLIDTEYLLSFRGKGAKAQPENYEDAHTYFITDTNTAQKREFGHPTIKNLAFCKRLLRNHTNEGDIVFDPFMGSGTTAVGCYDLNRKFVGCEINEEFYKSAQNRMGLFI